MLYIHHVYCVYVIIVMYEIAIVDKYTFMSAKEVIIPKL